MLQGYRSYFHKQEIGVLYLLQYLLILISIWISNIYNQKYIQQSVKQKQIIPMKLLQRNQMYENRFSQSFSEFNSNKFKPMVSTSGSFTSRHNHKLPQLSRSFSNSTAKSSTQRVSILDDRVHDLQKKTQDLKLQTRESRRFANFLREDLGQRELIELRNNLALKINTLDKYAKMNRIANQERTRLLKDDCQRLNDSSIGLKNLLHQLTQRTNTIEYAMGIYSGKQKHKI